MDSLVFSGFGNFLYEIVQNGQTNFIDCFPSGHVGALILVNLWFWKHNLPLKKTAALFLILVTIATFSLRYHYTLDAVAALPFALFCFYLARKKTALAQN